MFEVLVNSSLLVDTDFPDFQVLRQFPDPVETQVPHNVEVYGLRQSDLSEAQTTTETQNAGASLIDLKIYPYLLRKRMVRHQLNLFE